MYVVFSTEKRQFILIKKSGIKMATDISITISEAKDSRTMLSNVCRKMSFNLEFYTYPNYSSNKRAE